jgi:hypothetical protein
MEKRKERNERETIERSIPRWYPRERSSVDCIELVAKRLMEKQCEDNRQPNLKKNERINEIEIREKTAN